MIHIVHCRTLVLKKPRAHYEIRHRKQVDIRTLDSTIKAQLSNHPSGPERPRSEIIFHFRTRYRLMVGFVRTRIKFPRTYSYIVSRYKFTTKSSTRTEKGKKGRGCDADWKLIVVYFSIYSRMYVCIPPTLTTICRTYPLSSLLLSNFVHTNNTYVRVQLQTAFDTRKHPRAKNDTRKHLFKSFVLF